MGHRDLSVETVTVPATMSLSCGPAAQSRHAGGKRPHAVQVEPLCFTKCTGPLGTRARPRGSRTLLNFPHASPLPDATPKVPRGARAGHQRQPGGAEGVSIALVRRKLDSSLGRPQRARPRPGRVRRGSTVTEQACSLRHGHTVPQCVAHARHMKDSLEREQKCKDSQGNSAGGGDSWLRALLRSWSWGRGQTRGRAWR